MVHNLCYGCKDGIKHSFDEVEFNAEWAKDLFHAKADFDYLVLNSGAWYCGESAILNSTQSYEDMLKYMLLPTLKTLRVIHPKIQIYWLDLPPIVVLNATDPFQALKYAILKNSYVSRSVSNATSSLPTTVSEALEIQVEREYFKNFKYKESYEWNTMKAKNELARKYLTPMGVHYLDTRPALLPRKQTDPMVSADGLHWW